MAKRFSLKGFFSGGAIQTKSAPPDFLPSVSFADWLVSGGQGDLAAFECVRLYQKCMPFFDSVNRRADAFCSLPISVYDKDNDEWIAHDVQRTLNQPNAMQSGTAFLKAMSSFYDICGEVYLMATLNTRGEPMELYVIAPQFVSVTQSASIAIVGVAESYTVSTGVSTEKFELSKGDERGGSFRYINKLGNRMLWHVRDFNPSSIGLRGLPKAKPLWLQIQQFIEADTNNYSVLKRGGRPSVAWAWKHETPMTDEQFERMREQVKAYEGAANAGRQVVVDDVEPKVVSQTMRDMEFAQNRKTVREDIYTCYSIPLALVSSETMTMDNLKVGVTYLYDGAVLPLADKLLDEITRFIMPLFRDTENYIFRYDAMEVPVLKQKMIDEAAAIGKLGVLTDNELRSRIGYEHYEGGDTVYKPVNLVPAGFDLMIDNAQKNDDNAERYRKHLENIKDLKGNPAFSKEYIDRCVKEYKRGR